MNHEHSTDFLRALDGCINNVHMEDIVLDEPFLDMAARFAPTAGTTLLYSGGDLDCARYHMLGLWPWLSLRAYRGRVHLEVDGHGIDLTDDPLDVLARILDLLKLPRGQWPEPISAGLMGYLAYDLKDCLERLPRTSVDELGLPLMQWYAPSVTAIHDKETSITRLMVPLRDGRAEEAYAMIERFKIETAAPAPVPETYEIQADVMTSNFTAPTYHQSVQRIIDYIAAGDVYQVNMSQRFSAPFKGCAFSLFRRLADLNPAPFFAYIQAGDHQVISTSPERFIKHHGDAVEARPIKGTRPRDPDRDRDAAMRRELESSPKDDAELAMIVDLLRNDLGKVCRAGSVKVREHKRLEAYANVYHLVSIVDGKLDSGIGSTDIIRATFPGGSITGCPKVRAMEIIDELETCRRHVYCGSIGYISFHHTMDLSIAIRTATITDDRICFSMGGGVVFDSQPMEEYQETLHKGRTLLAACENADSTTACPGVVWFNGGLIADHEACFPASDLGVQYGFGFFETIRVDRGRAPLLTDHLARFNRTWRALMSDDPPDITWPQVIDQVIRANGLETDCAAVKLLATHGNGDRAPRSHGLLVTARSYRHRLIGKTIQGLHLGTYPHTRQTPLAEFKTLNYLFYYRAGRWAAENGFDEALILNPGGSVSETNTANLLLIEGRDVIKPRSSTVLPGVMAAAACRMLSTWGFRVTDETISVQRLLSAQQVLATNALMGCVPILSVDGRDRIAGRDTDENLWQRLNDALLAE